MGLLRNTIAQVEGAPASNRLAGMYNRGPAGLESLINPPRTPVGGELDRQKLMEMQRQTYRNFLTSPEDPVDPVDPVDPIVGEVYPVGSDYEGWPTDPPKNYDPEYLKEWNAKQSDVVKDAFSGNPHFIAATETGEYALTSEGKNAYDYNTTGTLPGGPPTAGAEKEPWGDREDRLEAAWDAKQTPPDIVLPGPGEPQSMASGYNSPPNPAVDEYLQALAPSVPDYVPQVIPDYTPEAVAAPPAALPAGFVGPTTDFRYSNIPEGIPRSVEDLDAYQTQWDQYLNRMYAEGGPVQKAAPMPAMDLDLIINPPRTPIGGEEDRQKLMDMQRETYRQFLVDHGTPPPQLPGIEEEEEEEPSPELVDNQAKLGGSALIPSRVPTTGTIDAILAGEGPLHVMKPDVGFPVLSTMNTKIPPRRYDMRGGYQPTQGEEGFVGPPDPNFDSGGGFLDRLGNVGKGILAANTMGLSTMIPGMELEEGGGLGGLLGKVGDWVKGGKARREERRQDRADKRQERLALEGYGPYTMPTGSTMLGTIMTSAATAPPSASYGLSGKDDSGAQYESRREAAMERREAQQQFMKDLFGEEKSYINPKVNFSEALAKAAGVTYGPVPEGRENRYLRPGRVLQRGDMTMAEKVLSDPARANYLRELLRGASPTPMPAMRANLA